MGSMLVLAAFVMVALHGAFGHSFAGDAGTFLGLEALPAWLVAFGVPLMVWGVMHAIAWHAGKQLDVGGRVRAVVRADTALRAARWFAVLWLWPALDAGWEAQADVFALGLAGLYEFVLVLPVLLVATLSWWSFYPIERRLREATMFRLLHEGGPIFRPPTRGEYVLGNVRHQLLLLLVPIMLIHTWGGVWHTTGAGLLELNEQDWPYLLTYYVGVVAIIACMPWVLRLIWDTRSLGDGAMRDSLLAVCKRNKVRVADLLVWRTSGTIVNALVTGILYPARYILLSDALLEGLPQRQVEAVAAHEVGHVRRRHLLWLGLITIVVSFGAVWLLAGVGGTVERAVPAWGDASLGPIAGVLPYLFVVGAAVMAFGSASRTFEVQADAFAVADMSRALHDGDSPPTVVRDDAIEAMSGALRSVAHLNGMNPRRFTFRHGSINTRLRYLQSLRGVELRRIAIDRKVRRVKLLTIVALLALPLGVLVKAAIASLS
jgi:STE24 endopeptidase